jgi:hypothetical protein
MALGQRISHGMVRHPVAGLIGYGLGAWLIGFVVVTVGARSNRPLPLGFVVAIGVGLGLLGCYYFFAAWYYATGRRSTADVDASYRRPTTIQRLLSRHHRGS